MRSPLTGDPGSPQLLPVKNVKEAQKIVVIYNATISNSFISLN